LLINSSTSLAVGGTWLLKRTTT